jgi:hypothetical protein
MPYIRQDQADIRVTIDGTPYGDSWKECEGGNLEAADTKIRPGGMGREVSAGGLPSRGDLTVRTNMTDVTATWITALENACGGGRAMVGISWLGPDRAPTGSRLTRRGTLKTVNTPGMGSGSDGAMLELVISCDELAG